MSMYSLCLLISRLFQWLKMGYNIFLFLFISFLVKQSHFTYLLLELAGLSVLPPPLLLAQLCVVYKMHSKTLPKVIKILGNDFRLCM